ncbi:kelch repeat-containing protein [Flaviaesturariibacter terrae]
MRTLLFFLLLATAAYGQNQPAWTWVNGDGNFSPTPSHYGTRGVASAPNKPPHRANACTWTDKQGNLWMFGGSEGLSHAFYNDLWKYSPASNTWTWMHGDTLADRPGNYGVKGVPHPLNKPAARSNAGCWIDSAGNLWLYGGYYVYSNNDFGILADLWKYDIGANEWIWVAGSSDRFALPVYGVQGVPSSANSPGAAERSACWTGRDGRFYLYGGFQVTTYNSGGWNSLLWSYDPATGMWTWVTGQKSPPGPVVPVPPVSLADGQFSDSNTPGGIINAATCVDSSGRLWLYGGQPSTGNFSNELWCFDPKINQWAMMRGNLAVTLPVRPAWPNVYGQRNVPDAANIPGARGGALLWTAGDDTIWMFGGEGFSDGPSPWDLSVRNDLWKFSIASKTWTWVKGDSTLRSLGRYGVKGVADTLNNPPARAYVARWTDQAGTFWLWGNSGYYTDLWSLNAGSIGKQTELELWGRFQGNDILVNWQTTREVGTHHFILEKGASRTAFSPIDSVPAAGYSIGTRSYMHNDLYPFADTNFYRLKIVNTGGAVSYSRTIALKRTMGGGAIDPGGASSGIIYPNPVRDVLHVRMTATGYNTITLFDATGRKVYEEGVFVNTPFTQQVNVSRWASGAYLLVLENAQARFGVKLVKL